MSQPLIRESRNTGRSQCLCYTQCSGNSWGVSDINTTQNKLTGSQVFEKCETVFRVGIWRHVKYESVRMNCAVYRRMMEHKLKRCTYLVVDDAGTSEIGIFVTL